MIDYFEEPLNSDYVTTEEAREQYEYWKDYFDDEKQNNFEEWKFFRNPFLSPEVYAYDILSDDEKRAILN